MTVVLADRERGTFKKRSDAFASESSARVQQAERRRLRLTVSGR